jgi:hypothetical protein
MNTQWKRTTNIQIQINIQYIYKNLKDPEIRGWRTGFSHGLARAFVAMVPRTCNRKKKPEILEATYINGFATETKSL